MWILFSVLSYFLLVSNQKETIETPLVSKKISINVKALGALGDGKHDDTFAIQQAIDSVSSVKDGFVFFPNGTYLVSKLSIQSSLKGSEKSIIKNIKTDYSPYIFCNVRGVDGIFIEKITFDGSVRSNENGDVVAGSIPLFVYQSKNIKIANCKFINSPMSGLRLENCELINVRNSFSGNHQGVFGDGYYMDYVRKSTLQKCVAKNYSRIGFVTENNSSDITIIDCQASEGKNASITKGGTEFNAGFWYENSINIRTVNCKAIDNLHRGFVATTGNKIKNIVDGKSGSFVFENCESIRNPLGFALGSSGFPVTTKMINCKANYVTTGFHINARSNFDDFYFKNCTVKMNPLTEHNLNHVGFNWESAAKQENSAKQRLPHIKFDNCHVQYINPNDLSKVLNRNSNSGDISTYGGGAIDIEINNFTNSFKKQPVIIKARKGRPYYKFNNTTYDPRFVILNKK